ncbi:19172_t:CDS:2 [Dentiscutata erythropus]|uniref:19172_t:CDS:1 n=1 Tax=Dentiscutata erythropus TaxID=1348616 RepID=A0A9N9F4Q4_9GLOM|nr:19172_t:CDS:2 [Dentiscutata erythropus]
MVHQLPTNEKDSKRISLLEQRVEDLENTLLRTANTILEARVAELETSLKESNEECDKLRRRLAETEMAMRKDVSDCGDSDIENICEDVCEDTFKDIEFDRVYGRILKLVNTMKSDCTTAIHFKISMSSLPKFQSPKLSSPSGSPRTPPASPLTPSSAKTPPVSPFTPSSAKIPIHSRTSSMSTGLISSRPNTPSSSIKPPSSIPNSPIMSPARIPAPLKTQGLPSPSSLPNTPTSIRSPTTSLSNPAIQQSLRLSRSRTPSLSNLSNLASSCNYDSSIPSPLGAQSSQSPNGISSIPSYHSNIPSGHAPKPTGTDTLLMHGRVKNKYSQNYSNLTQSTPSSQAIKV